MENTSFLTMNGRTDPYQMQLNFAQPFIKANIRVYYQPIDKINLQIRTKICS